MARGKQHIPKLPALVVNAPPTVTTRRRGANKDEYGQRPFEPTDEQREAVSTLVACGVAHKIIAIELDISESTLQRHFKPELENGLARANGRISSLVFNDAVAGRGAARFFWLKCRAGWKEGSTLEIAGKDGEAIQINTNSQMDWSQLSREERRELENLLRKAKADDADAS